MRTNEHKMKAVVMNIDGNLYYFKSVSACAKYLGFSVAYTCTLIRDCDTSYLTKFRVRLEYYDENIHKNIKAYMS